VHFWTVDRAADQPCPDAAPELLASARDARDLIDEAKRTVMERHGLPADEAFEVLRHYSRSCDRPLRDVARKVVHGTWLPVEQSHDGTGTAVPSS
jgi:hypothetical protein